MKFDEDAQLDTSQVEDIRKQGGRRSGGLGGGLGGTGLPLPRGKGMAAGGGGIVAILVLLFTLLTRGGGGIDLGNASINPGDIGASSAVVDQSGSDVAQNCRTGADANERDDCLVVGVTNSAQAFWADDFAKRGARYVPAKTTLFRDSVDTGCGPATSSVGPFYCPADNHVYIDLGFFDEFETTFKGQNTDFTKAYVIAHEYGHHIQNLLGTSDQVQRSGDRQGAESAAVRLELQADCYAGVWAVNATRGGLITELTEQDIREGLDAAARVGDDYIQREVAGRRVDPDSWTHGSSEQRQRWFLVGYESGELSDCDTFNQDI